MKTAAGQNAQPECDPLQNSQPMYGNDIAKTVCRRKLEELVRGGNNFVFNTFRYPEPVQRFENLVMVGGPGRCN